MKTIKIFLLIGLTLLLETSCKKSNSGSDNAYPRQASITYRVSSTTTNNLVSITYQNETGGLSSMENPSLPFSKTISRSVNKYDIVTLGYFVNPAQTVKLEILVNSQVVKSQEFTASNSSLSYTFQ